MSHIVIGALIAARDYLREAANPHPTYGYYPGGTDPRDFSPDVECCTEAELAAHKAACEAWERGERPDPGGPHRALGGGELPADAVSALKVLGEDGAVIGGHVTIAHYGIGTYSYRDEDAEDALDQIEAALASLDAAGQ